MFTSLFDRHNWFKAAIYFLECIVGLITLECDQYFFDSHFTVSVEKPKYRRNKVLMVILERQPISIYRFSNKSCGVGTAEYVQNDIPLIGKHFDKKSW